MPNLLVPVDGSDYSLRALEHAIGLARKDGASSLHIVTVVPEPPIYGEIEIYVSRERLDEMQRRHGEGILARAMKIAKAAYVPYTAEILIGDTAPQIVSHAEALGCDGIVMGTRGMSAIANLIMGSIATKVVHLTKIPVTLVK